MTDRVGAVFGQGKGIESPFVRVYPRPMNKIFPLAVALLCAGCTMLPFGFRQAAMQPTAPIGTRPEARPLDSGATRPAAGAVTVQALDTTTAADKAKALEAPAAKGATNLGKTIVTLGLVTEPGFWLRSALVPVAGTGHVETANGASIKLTLIPGEGAAQLSLAAFRALNLPLTGLPEVTVFAN